MQVTKYAAVLPKIGHERSLLLSEPKIKALIESKSVAEIISQLRDTPYQEQISRLSSPVTGRKLERAFKENYIETSLRIIKYAPKQAKRYIDIYLVSLELENIKTLIRSANAKLDAEQRTSRLYLEIEKYFNRLQLIENATQASSVSQVVQAFKGTEYESTLNMSLKSYQETGSTVAFDVLIDALFYEKHCSAFEALPKREKPHAYPYVSLLTDSFILLSLLRGKNLDYEPNWLRLAMPHCFFNLDKKQVESITTALNFEAAFKIAHASYYAKFFELKDTPESTIAYAEKAFREALLAYAKKSVIREIFNVGSTLSFITLKEAEVHNLTAISLGVDGGVSPEAVLDKLLF